jgi:hypothetical protein
MNTRTRRPFAAFALAFMLVGTTAMAVPHEGICPYCQLDLVQNTDAQDNEVVVKAGNKRIEYRCLFCVVKDEKRYQGDLVVYAPSEKVGQPVILRRVSGEWKAPEGAVFLNAFVSHAQCASLSRAFSNRAAFDAYVEKHSVDSAKPLTLPQFLAEVRAR